MRRYLRHSTDMPLTYRIADQAPEISLEHLADISAGGLCFSSNQFIDPGHVMSVNIDPPPFSAKGVVVWCRPDERRFKIGVAFANPEDPFSVRMVDQICRIEEYRQQVMDEEDRHLNSEQAAFEWIEKFAGDYPAQS
ncbi:PilZ domain-containing protein [Nitrincola sp. MINF-07-Sa-05]|uniref:PilZ domain-containing protein n=1 Tax=Nitrincola salilacus TaxID=3400273 RepID=UPI0039181255